MYKFEDLKGETLKCAFGRVGDDRFFLETITGKKYMLYCKEEDAGTCEIAGIEGTLTDIIGSRILFVEKTITKDVNPAGANLPEFQDSSFTWTYCTIATKHGRVLIAFYAESDGHHNESISLDKINSFACA